MSAATAVNLPLHSSSGGSRGLAANIAASQISVQNLKIEKTNDTQSDYYPEERSSTFPLPSAALKSSMESSGSHRISPLTSAILRSSPSATRVVGDAVEKAAGDTRGISLTSILESDIGSKGVISNKTVKSENALLIDTVNDIVPGVRVGVVHDQNGRLGNVSDNHTKKKYNRTSDELHRNLTERKDGILADSTSGSDELIDRKRIAGDINHNVMTVINGNSRHTEQSFSASSGSISQNERTNLNLKVASVGPADISKTSFISSPSFTDKTTHSENANNSDKQSRLPPPQNFNSSANTDAAPLLRMSGLSSDKSEPTDVTGKSAEEPSPGNSSGFLCRFGRFVMERSVLLLKTAAVFSAVAMQITPIPTVRLIARAQSTGDLDGLPYIMLMFSACLWMVYGILRMDAIIMLPNITGLMLGGWYVGTYHSYCNNSTYRRSLDGYYQTCGFVAVSLLITLAVIGKNLGTSIVGLTAAFFNVISYGAPLAGLRIVIRDKSTACMPAEVSIGNFVCSSLWLAYGCVVSDLFVIVPNLLGVVVGSLQIGLLAIFPPPRSRGFDIVKGRMELLSSSDKSSESLKRNHLSSQYNSTNILIPGNTNVQRSTNAVYTWISNYSTYWSGLDKNMMKEQVSSDPNSAYENMSTSFGSDHLGDAYGSYSSSNSAQISHADTESGPVHQ